MLTPISPVPPAAGHPDTDRPLPFGKTSACDGSGHRFALCICTYRRPDKLRHLLSAIDKTQAVASDRLRIVVVDNCPSASSAAVCTAYSEAGRFDLLYVHEPRKGLANARNAAIEAALPIAQSIVFIDDDEVPMPGWIEALALAAGPQAAALAVGPVHPLFEKPPAAWAVRGGFYGVWPRILGNRALEGYTGNALIRCSAVRDLGLRFLDRFNHTGGEDSFFFSELQSQGFEIAWAERAVTYEWIPEQRMSLKWLIRRWYRTGITEAELGGAQRAGLFHRGVTMARGIARMLGGTVLAAAAAAAGGWRDPSKIIGRLYTIARGAGLISHALGRIYNEYEAPASVRSGGATRP